MTIVFDLIMIGSKNKLWGTIRVKEPSYSVNKYSAFKRTKAEYF